MKKRVRPSYRGMTTVCQQVVAAPPVASPVGGGGGGGDVAEQAADWFATCGPLSPEAGGASAAAGVRRKRWSQGCPQLEMTAK